MTDSGGINNRDPCFKNSCNFSPIRNVNTFILFCTMLQFPPVSVKLRVRFCRQLVKGRAADLGVAEAGVYCWTGTGPVPTPPREPVPWQPCCTVPELRLPVEFCGGGLTRRRAATGHTAHALGHNVIRQKACFRRGGRKSSNGTREACKAKVTLPACSEKGDDGAVCSKQINTLPDVDCMNLWLM